eukprot:GDKJ01018735.1.p1 GENE.GDKJ01018735.1~~GDKJ01018735.1.p1  ORF type:complete len:1010 (+),score=272.68 GDKJ01018735.1:291-3032(+)
MIKNPLVKALAVRTMGCIRLAQVTEYLIDPLKQCCNDEDPYVRKTAAICVSKLYDISPDMVTLHGFVEILQKMLSDTNPMVVANAVASLSEIHQADPSLRALRITDETALKLLAALNECTEWGQVFILEALTEYNPPDISSVESVLDRVSARLSHANPAVVLTAIRIVMKLLDRLSPNSEVEKAMLRKLSPPLVTLLSAEPELQYVALRNISFIVQKKPGILQNDVRMFFARYNDPPYVKNEKLDVICRLANDKNCDQVLLELKEYAQEVDVDFVRRAVRAIGRVAIKLEVAADKAVRVVLDLVDSKIPHVVQEAIVVIRDVFRRYPDRYEQVIAPLCSALKTLEEPQARAAMIWIIGEYAHRIQNAHELLAAFVEGQTESNNNGSSSVLAPAGATHFKDEPVEVQLQILTAAVKVFLRNPQKGQALVQKVLHMATQESDDPDLRDRGYVYWRLLSSDPQGTRQVALSSRPPITAAGDALEPQALNMLVANISSLASVYHRAPVAFVPSALAAVNAMSRKGEERSGAAGGTSKGKSAGGALNFLDVDEEDEEDQRKKMERINARMQGKGTDDSESEEGGAEEEDDDSDEDHNAASKIASTAAAKSTEKKKKNLLDFDDDEEGEATKSTSSPLPSNPFNNKAATPSQTLAPGYAAPKSLVLQNTTAGSRGASGLAVLASAGLSADGVPAIFLAFKNMTPQGVTLDNWSCEINSNPYGIAAAGPLEMGPLVPQQSMETVLPLRFVPSFKNGQPLPASGTNLFLQVAIKCSLDVFYCNVPYDVDLFMRPAMSTIPADAAERFKADWLLIPDTQIAVLFFQTSNGLPLSPLSLPNSAPIAALKARGFNLLTTRTAPAFECAYLKAVSVENEVVLVELAAQRESNNVKISVKCGNLALARAAVISTAKVLGVVPVKSA